MKSLPTLPLLLVLFISQVVYNDGRVTDVKTTTHAPRIDPESSMTFVSLYCSFYCIKLFGHFLCHSAESVNEYLVERFQF